MLAAVETFVNSFKATQHLRFPFAFSTFWVFGIKRYRSKVRTTALFLLLTSQTELQDMTQKIVLYLGYRSGYRLGYRIGYRLYRPDSDAFNRARKNVKSTPWCQRFMGMSTLTQREEYNNFILMPLNSKT